MTSTLEAASPPVESQAPAPGRLEIDDRVVERIAAVAATEVAGVAGLPRLFGDAVNDRPRVAAEVGHGRARLRIQVSVGWPAPLRTTCAQVRERVRQRVQDLTGLDVVEVDVTVGSLVTGATTQRVV
jgi:uncharacterized alkaline shock family protein YloU